MAQFFEVRTVELDRSLYLNPDTIAEFVVFDTHIEYKGVNLCREDFVSMLVASESTVQSLGTPEPVETVETDTDEIPSDRESAE